MSFLAKLGSGSDLRTKVRDKIVKNSFTISLDNDQIQKLIELDQSHLSLLKSKGIHNLQIRFAKDRIQLYGSFENSNLTGTFQIELQPHMVYWSGNNHALQFKVLKTSVNMDKDRFRNIMSCFIYSTARFVLGDERLLKLAGLEIQNDIITIRFDDLHQISNRALQNIELLDLYCIDDALVIAFRVTPDVALRDIKDIYYWTKN